MKIVCISDTHNMLDCVDIPDGDILIHAGDATGQGTIREIEKFNQDLGKLGHPVKIFVPGNHDWLWLNNEQLARGLLTNATTLIDEEIEVGGLKIYGSPWQPEFCDWAFNLPRGPKLAEKWAAIPDDTDMLVGHSPAYGYLDQTNLSINTPHLGCENLLDRIKKLRLKYFIHGHIHGGVGKDKINDTVIINASICNEEYQPINKPLVINI